MLHCRKTPMSLKTNQISESHVRSTLSANEFKLKKIIVFKFRDLSATKVIAFHINVDISVGPFLAIQLHLIHSVLGNWGHGHLSRNFRLPCLFPGAILMTWCCGKVQSTRTKCTPVYYSGPRFLQSIVWWSVCISPALILDGLSPCLKSVTLTLQIQYDRDGCADIARKAGIKSPYYDLDDDDMVKGRSCLLIHYLRYCCYCCIDLVLVLVFILKWQTGSP